MTDPTPCTAPDPTTTPPEDRGPRRPRHAARLLALPLALALAATATPARADTPHDQADRTTQAPAIFQLGNPNLTSPVITSPVEPDGSVAPTTPDLSPTGGLGLGSTPLPTFQAPTTQSGGSDPGLTYQLKKILNTTYAGTSQRKQALDDLNLDPAQRAAAENLLTLGGYDRLLELNNKRLPTPVTVDGTTYSGRIDLTTRRALEQNLRGRLGIAPDTQLGPSAPGLTTSTPVPTAGGSKSGLDAYLAPYLKLPLYLYTLFGLPSSLSQHTARLGSVEKAAWRLPFPAFKDIGLIGSTGVPFAKDPVKNALWEGALNGAATWTTEGLAKLASTFYNARLLRQGENWGEFMYKYFLDPKGDALEMLRPGANPIQLESELPQESTVIGFAYPLVQMTKKPLQDAGILPAPDATDADGNKQFSNFSDWLGDAAFDATGLGLTVSGVNTAGQILRGAGLSAIRGMMGAAFFGPAVQILCAKALGEPYKDQPALVSGLVGAGCAGWSLKDFLDFFKKGGNGPPPPAAGATPVVVDAPAPQPTEGEDGGSTGLSLWRPSTTNPLATGTFSPAGIVSTPTTPTVPDTTPDGCDTSLPAGAIRWATGKCPGTPGHPAGEPVFGAKTVGAGTVGSLVGPCLDPSCPNWGRWHPVGQPTTTAPVVPSAPVTGSGSVTPKASVPAVQGAPSRNRSMSTSGQARSTSGQAATAAKPGGSTVQAPPPAATSVPSPWTKKDPNEQWLTEHCGKGGDWLTRACRFTSNLNPTYPGSPVHSLIFGAGGEGAVAPVVP